MNITERDDIAEACKVAQREPQPQGVTPHWLRCQWCRGDFDAPGPKLRCRLGDGHSGDHVYG